MATRSISKQKQYRKSLETSKTQSVEPWEEDPDTTNRTTSETKVGTEIVVRVAQQIGTMNRHHVGAMQTNVITVMVSKLVETRETTDTTANNNTNTHTNNIEMNALIRMITIRNVTTIVETPSTIVLPRMWLHHQHVTKQHNKDLWKC